MIPVRLRPAYDTDRTANGTRASDDSALGTEIDYIIALEANDRGGNSCWLTNTELNGITSRGQERPRPPKDAVKVTEEEKEPVGSLGGYQSDGLGQATNFMR